MDLLKISAHLVLPPCYKPDQYEDLITTLDTTFTTRNVIPTQASSRLEPETKHPDKNTNMSEFRASQSEHGVITLRVMTRFGN
jgi:hypothetical protein